MSNFLEIFDLVDKRFREPSKRVYRWDGGQQKKLQEKSFQNSIFKFWYTGITISLLQSIACRITMIMSNLA